MSKISLGQLDLIALQQYFEIVAGFRKKDDKAIDVQYVGEFEHATIDDTDGITETEKSKVEAYQVAMAALDEYGWPISYTDEHGAIIIPERQTVLNSLMLDGVPAAEFLKRVESDTILTDVNQATYNMADDIRNIKDELYQLKNQLVKTGTIKDSNVYNGFIDCFLESNKKNIVSTGVRVVSVSSNTITVESLGDLRAGDLIILEDINGNFNLQRILAISGANEITIDLEYEGSTGPVTAQFGSFIRKSLGVGKNGKYVFAVEPEQGLVETDEFKYIVKDGIERIKVFELDHAGHGFGTEIKIPASLDSCVLNKIRVSLAVKGDPGEIKGVFWKYDELAMVYNKTDYVTYGVKGLEASSWFNDFTMELVTEMPVRPGEKYILLLESTMGSEDDKWFIGGFAEDDCDDEVHNDSYIQSNEILYKSVDDTDMFLIINVKKMQEAELKRLNFGLYTCNFDIHQSLANRLRVELCVNQEGLFKVSDKNYVNLARAKMTEVPLNTKGGEVYKDNVFAKGDYVVLGDQFSEVASVGIHNSNVILKDDTFIGNNVDVYRMGYEIQAIVSNKEYEPAVNGVIARYKDAEVYPLKFVGVVPGRDVIRPYQSSDRLLFECEFYDQDDLDNIKLKSFNHIQLQVAWHGNVDNNVLQANDKLEGAIFDISASVDQAYTKQPGGAE
jgi:hypothetical protein